MIDRKRLEELRKQSNKCISHHSHSLCESASFVSELIDTLDAALKVVEASILACRIYNTPSILEGKDTIMYLKLDEALAPFREGRDQTGVKG